MFFSRHIYREEEGRETRVDVRQGELCCFSVFRCVVEECVLVIFEEKTGICAVELNKNRVCILM